MDRSWRSLASDTAIQTRVPTYLEVRAPSFQVMRASRGSQAFIFHLLSFDALVLVIIAGLGFTSYSQHWLSEAESLSTRRVQNLRT